MTERIVDELAALIKRIDVYQRRCRGGGDEHILAEITESILVEITEGIAEIVGTLYGVERDTFMEMCGNPGGPDR